MNFMEAVKAMGDGKSVKREELDNEKSIFAGSEGLPLAYFLSTDWEIYEEEDNWNLAEIGYKCQVHNKDFTQEEIKTFI